VSRPSYPHHDAARRRISRRARRYDGESEPSYEDDPDVVEWGGQLIWAVDFTAGGAPIGLTVEELHKMEASWSRAGWARAKRVLESVFARHDTVEIGRVRKVGEGLSHEVFAAYVEVRPDAGGRSGAYAVYLPNRRADPEQRADPMREATLLDRVAAETQAIRVPDVTAVVSTDGGDVMVRRYLEGIPLDLRAGHQHGVRPWEIVGQVAATIHGIDVMEVSGLAGYPTSREHALAEIVALGDLPELREAEEWALANVPPDEPSVLLHGDLLGQNILLHPSEPPAIIDWEATMLGDPAYDLAIITRGVRRPFQIERGLERLLDAYAACAPWRITASAVHLHELCLAGRWYREALEGVSAREPADQALRRVEQVLGRARAAARERCSTMR
jgi:aminoglycoside phosphotransferase (APT) family kinase protein